MTLYKDQAQSEADGTREYTVGQWFTPLPTLIEFPKVPNDDGRSWHYSFRVVNFGEFDLDFSHSDDFYRKLKNRAYEHLPIAKALLVLPDRVELITEDNIDDWQKELETPILYFEGLNLSSGSKTLGQFPDLDERSTSSPAYLEVDTPSGIVLRAPFMDFRSKKPDPIFPGVHVPSIGALSFIWQGELDNSGILIPDGRHIAQNTQFRIVTE